MGKEGNRSNGHLITLWPLATSFRTQTFGPTPSFLSFFFVFLNTNFLSFVSFFFLFLVENGTLAILQCVYSSLFKHMEMRKKGKIIITVSHDNCWLVYMHLGFASFQHIFKLSKYSESNLKTTSFNINFVLNGIQSSDHTLYFLFQIPNKGNSKILLSLL